jgi:hypothetical protein
LLFSILTLYDEERFDKRHPVDEYQRQLQKPNASLVIRDVALTRLLGEGHMHASLPWRVICPSRYLKALLRPHLSIVEIIPPPNGAERRTCHLYNDDYTHTSLLTVKSKRMNE